MTSLPMPFSSSSAASSSPSPGLLRPLDGKSLSHGFVGGDDVADDDYDDDSFSASPPLILSLQSSNLSVARLPPRFGWEDL